MTDIVKIQGKIQHYQWGGTAFIPKLINQPNPQNQPCAEYWLGTHPCAPATLCDAGFSEGSPESARLLSEYLSREKLPELQFLLKVLDVRDMLSIQVHPTKEQARQGYARENAAKIALDARDRNYKDESDKPELAVALSDFWLLHGLRQESDIIAQLSEMAYLAPLHEVIAAQGLRAGFSFALQRDSVEVVEMHEALCDDVLAGRWEKHQIQFWMQRWLHDNPDERLGLLTLFFLNLVRLRQGEAIFQPAGLLHAYLEGQTIELMANSDNVLRAGLTPKHIDVPELMAVCQFVSSAPGDFIIRPKNRSHGEVVFPTPFDAFELSRQQLDAGQKGIWESTCSEVVLCTAGSARFHQPSGSILALSKGETVFIPCGYTSEWQSEGCCLYRARNL